MELVHPGFCAMHSSLHHGHDSGNFPGFNSSDDHYIYYCGQESLRRNGIAIMVNKRVRNAVLGCSQKRQNDLCSFPRQNPFNITVIQVYAPTGSAEEPDVEWFYEDLQDFLD